MLRKKSETGRTLVSKRKSINASNIKEARDFLRDFLDIMDVPADEDGLVSFIIDKFTAMKTHYEELLGRYDGKNYPDKQVVKHAIDLSNEILSQKKDNVALVSALIKKEDDLYDSKDNMHKVEEFFRSQVQIYDSAVKMLDDLHNEAKKAEKAAERKALRAAKAKAEKELMKEIGKSGLSIEEVKTKLGIE
jgi:hypothetical protein